MFLLTILIFILVAAGGSLLGVKFWIRPKEAIERVTGATVVEQEEAPVHPSLVFRDVLQRLGNLIPASPKDVTVMQRRMIRAGIRNPNALKYLYGSKVVLAVALPIIAAAFVAGSDSDLALLVFWVRTST
jgi:tight adherence protein C